MTKTYSFELFSDDGQENQYPPMTFMKARIQPPVGEISDDFRENHVGGSVTLEHIATTERASAYHVTVTGSDHEENSEALHLRQVQQAIETLQGIVAELNAIDELGSEEWVGHGYTRVEI